MPSLRERNGRWYLSVSRHGKRREVAVGKDERLAGLRLAEETAAIERQKSGFFVERPATLQESIDRWLATRGATLAPSTLTRSRIYADNALRLLDGDCPLQADDVRRYQGARLQAGAKAKTVNNEVAWLQQVVRREDGTLPWGRPVKKLKVRDARPIRWLTSEEVRRLLSAAIPRARPYLLGYLFTGARREELLAVRWRDVDLVRGVIRLSSAKTAGRTAGDSHRTVPVHPDLKPVLEAARAAGQSSPWPAPTDQHRVRTWVVTAAERAGIRPRPTLHDLRHTFASHLVQAGVSLYVVGRLLGHTNPATTAIYSHLAVESLDRAVGLLRY
jgi:integrase